MGQHAHGVEARGQCLAVGTDVDAVGQSADDEHLGAQLPQVGDEAAHQVLPVGGAVARAHDVDDARLVQVGIAFIIEHEGRVGHTRAAAADSRLVVEGQRLDVVLVDELHLGSCPFQGVVPVLQRLDKTRGAVGHDVADVVAVLIDGTGAAQRLVELQGHLLVEARHAGEGYAVVCLVGVRYYWVNMGWKARS